MSGKNSARKFGPPTPEEQAQIDADWELPDEFVHTKSTPPEPKAVQRNVSLKAKEASTPAPNVSGEDTLNIGDGQVLFEDMLNKIGVGFPPHMFINSGREISDQMYMLFDSGVLYAKTSPGQTPSNKDGVMASYYPENLRLRVLLASGPQHDQQAADIASVAAVKSGIEDAVHPNSSLEQSFQQVTNNVNDVKEEFGIGNKPVSITELELQWEKLYDSRSYNLRIANSGDNHCFRLDPKSGEVEKISLKEKLSSDTVTGGDIIVIASDALMQSIETDKGTADIQLGNKIFMDLKSSDKGLRGICDEIIGDAEKRQNKGEIVDSSFSIIVLEVPEPETQM